MKSPFNHDQILLIFNWLTFVNTLCISLFSMSRSKGGSEANFKSLSRSLSLLSSSVSSWCKEKLPLSLYDNFIHVTSILAFQGFKVPTALTLASRPVIKKNYIYLKCWLLTFSHIMKFQKDIFQDQYPKLPNTSLISKGN